MNRLIPLGMTAATLAAALTWWFWPYQQPAVEVVDPNSSIVFFGDSLVYGTGAEPEESVTAVLAARLDVPIINSGHPGDTTADALGRLQRDVLAHDPALVVILLGGNDALQRISPEETFAHLQQIIDRIQASGSQVVLVGVRGGVLRDGYEKQFASLAHEKQVWYVPDILDGIFTDPTLKSDQIHPNAAGYRAMANRLEPVLRSYLPE